MKIENPIDLKLLEYLMEGLTIKEAAAKLNVTSMVVKHRLRQMREENVCKNSLQLIAKWVLQNE